MSGAVHRVDQDYWQPPRHEEGVQAAPAARALACPECGTEFVVGSRFCQVCGADREAADGSRQGSWTDVLEFNRIRDFTGLSSASLVCLAAGIICVIAAVVTGFMYTANTVLDWQAVQVWRIEWLLAAAVAFIAGILFKRPQVR